ncbi:MAG: hypothetical protein JWP64_4685 [Pseudonocardia sp.]|uniref:cytochrome P450 n=1 Tax=Pseudonocardia sp. TaxID=60912 RepID=UPI00262C72F4|nr:cytochrome P450 [Pseudonocardia sp.]MCU1629736.1 hypothetical protein [Pseudonocardia sp.]
MTSQTVDFSPFAPDVIEDPYPFYEVLRRESPVHNVGGAGLWVLSRYDDNVFALRNPEVFSSTIISDTFSGEYNPIPDHDGVMMLSSDPPEHTRLRRLMASAFTPKSIAALRSSIAEYVDEAIERVSPLSEFDFVQEIAQPLPVKTFFTLMGVPESLHAQCKAFTDVESEIASTIASGEPLDSEWVARMKKSQQDYGTFLCDLIDQRRAEPGDDLVSALVAASDAGDKLTEIEVRKMLQLLNAAGTESTQKFISNMLLTFLRHPEQYQMLRTNRELIPNAVQEALRYDGSGLHMPRLVLHDVELSGVTLPKGAVCLLSFGSANHDESKFSDRPEHFDITRDTTGSLGHLAFGHGIHRCLGANLATLEATVVLEKLLEHYSGFSWNPDAAVRDTKNFFIRGLRNLPISPVVA